MKFIHIVPTSSSQSGGVSYAAIRLAQEQLKFGYDVEIFDVSVNGKNLRSSDLALNHIQSNGVQWPIKLLWKFYKVLNKQTVVIFHGFWYPRYLPYSVIVLLKRPIYVVFPHGSLEYEALKVSFLKKKVSRLLFYDCFLSHANALVACSDKELLTIRCQFIKSRTEVISIGVDLPIPKKRITAVNGVKTIFILSRLHPGKGLINFIDAWAMIKDDAWRIVIAGPDENNHKNALIERISFHGLDSFFTFTGSVDSIQKDELYRMADIFALPSLSENFGIVVLEALSYGIPVLTTNRTPWSYVGIDRGCLCVGVYPSELAVGLRTLMSLTLDELCCVKKNAVDFVKDNFLWDKVGVDSIKTLSSLSND